MWPLSLRVRQLDEIAADIERRADLPARLKSCHNSLKQPPGCSAPRKNGAQRRQKAHAEESRTPGSQTAHCRSP